MNIALVGNPNCGKTTLFNSLTGSRCKTGNFTGVTVECKKGVCGRHTITDLPGIYSLTSVGAEEKAARDFILKENPNTILNVVDATNLSRNLYLTTQLSELGIPMIIALNMTDSLAKNGLLIDTDTLEKLLGIRVIPVSAAKEHGISELKKALSERVTVRKKAFKNDDERRHFTDTVISQSVSVTGENKQFLRTEKIDKILLSPSLSVPIFAAVMLAVFGLTFGQSGKALSDDLDWLFNIKLAGIFSDSINCGGFVKGLVVNGIIAGVGGVAKFFPQIMLLFLCLAFLEDCGYMARTAFIADNFFQKFGLGGKSFLPLLTGFGCSVPAAMSVRMLESARDRKLTLFLIPFMSCSAKLPIYTLFSAVLFPKNSAFVIFSLYIIGIFLGAVTGIVFNKVFPPENDTPFLLELPPYRMPSLKTLLAHIREKAKDFALRAGTVLLTSSVVIWLLENLDFTLRLTADKRNSILGTLGSFLAPIFAPCGFGTPDAAISILSGFAAKEAIVSTFAVLSGGNPALAAASFSSAGGYAFLVFVLLCTPCTAALTAIGNEFNSKRLTAFLIVWQFVIAWCSSAVIYQILNFFL